MKGAVKYLNVDSIDALGKTIRLNAQPYLRDRYNFFYNWYQQTLGTEEVKKCQERVTYLQEQLSTAQEQRREISYHLTEVRKKATEVQEQLNKVKRQDNLQRYLDLMTQETELLKEEQSFAESFRRQDQLEREVFTLFTGAIRDAHERQRTQLEYTRYYGYFFTILGSFLSFLYTSSKNKDMKKIIENNMADSFDSLVGRLERNEKAVQSSVEKMESENSRLIEFLDTKFTQQDKRDDTMARIAATTLDRTLEMGDYIKNQTVQVVEPMQLASTSSVKKVMFYGVLALIGTIALKAVTG